MAITDPVQIRVRRDSLANFQTRNEVHAAGEPLHVIDDTHNDWLSGDGVRDFSALWSDTNAIAGRAAKSASDATKSASDAAKSASDAAGAVVGLAPKASPAFTGVATLNGQQLAPAATPYPYWRKKLAQVRAGISDAKILCLGDSTTYGYVAPPNNVPTPAIASYPSDLAAIMNAYFAPAFVGLGIPKDQSGSSVDGRWTLGSGWAAAPGDAIGWSARELYKASAGAGGLVYTPGGSSGLVDTFDVYYVANGSSPAFTIQATGGAAVTVTPGSQNGVFKASCSAGSAATTNAVTITPTSDTGTRRIVGVEGYNSTVRRVRVGNTGVGGSSSKNWTYTSNAYQSFACIEAYAPDLTIIDLGLNDMAAPNTTPAAFEANITALVASARKSGDVILMVPPPPQIGGSSNLTDGYNALLPSYLKLATQLGTGLVDINGRWGSYAALNPLGYYSDTLHPSRIGYGDIAQAMSALLRAI